MAHEYADSVAKLSQFQNQKLEKNAHKGRWEDVEPIAAFKRLIDEASELLEAVINGYSVKDVWEEAADVSNFALIMAESYERKVTTEAQLAKPGPL